MTYPQLQVLTAALDAVVREAARCPGVPPELLTHLTQGHAELARLRDAHRPVTDQ